jgi:maltooligosyltrehalose trehalohydrolase
VSGPGPEAPFAVWAPRPTSVRLRIGDTTITMQRGDDGWWRPDPTRLADVLRGRADAADGSVRYGYVIDGTDRVRPDPRSRWQPDGVHAMSATFDPSAFAWTDHSWTGRGLEGAVIYELHIGTFTPEGTLDAAHDRLDHLVELGVDFVELLPVNAFNGAHNWGYDGVLWYAVDDTYGGPAAYQRFVDRCHGLGLGVIQDVVYNHLGPSGNYLPEFAPYLHDAEANTWGASVNFGEDEVRAYVIDNALMWLRDHHVDGLRLDAVHALVDHRSTHILAELAGRTAALSRDLGRLLTLIAESDLNDPAMITPVADGGLGMDGQWSDDFHHAVHVALTREVAGYYADFEPLGALAKVMTGGFFHDGTYSSFRGRDHGRPIDVTETPAWRLVVADQNHDQIGNRAMGDRLSATLDDRQLAIAAVLTLAGPFTPMLFMGEEWGATTPWQFFTAHPEPELGRATAEGRLEEFSRMGWDPSTVPDPQDESTFQRSKLRWSELDEPAHRDLFTLYKSLIAARRAHPQLLDPRFASDVDHLDEEGLRWIVVRRPSGVIIAVNFADARVRVRADGDVLIATESSFERFGHELELAGRSAVVLLHAS